MGGSPLQPLRYTKQVSVWLTPEDYDKLCKAAKKLGYGSEDPYHIKNLKKPKTGAARLIREVLEKYLFTP